MNNFPFTNQQIQRTSFEHERVGVIIHKNVSLTHERIQLKRFKTLTNICICPNHSITKERSGFIITYIPNMQIVFLLKTQNSNITIPKSSHQI
ncbi:hypothetical protein OIU77_005061 [Salix suchowensis]|uniref:Uncharacterized protein n=1 Tax=Salix suchowensis TaxID=1278906 RepID=A0ABQ9APM3_9ROSI|nr:hypothetical protein OIU78_023690 [Salix suchowensis]KAJ6354369.1 hypothetical protein OIU77_005061 [Salix suchowensis]